MTLETKILLETALKAKSLYHTGKINYEQAVELIRPYVDHFNKRSNEVAAKFNQRPKPISISMFMR